MSIVLALLLMIVGIACFLSLWRGSNRPMRIVTNVLLMIVGVCFGCGGVFAAGLSSFTMNPHGQPSSAAVIAALVVALELVGVGCFSLGIMLMVRGRAAKPNENQPTGDVIRSPKRGL